MLSQSQYRRQMLDTIVAMIPLLLMSAFYYGPRVFVMALISVSCAVAADYCCLLLQGRYWWEKYDCSAVIAGLLYVLMLPASAPYWLVVVGALFAILVIRQPFGGHYNTLFSPALTAFAFVIIAWRELATRYPAVHQWLPLTPSVDVPLYTSSAYRLMLGGAESLDLLDTLLGEFVGPLGGTCVLVLLLCGVFLAVRKTILWQIPLATFSVVALFACLLPRIKSSLEASVMLEFSSGVLILSVLFVAAMDNGEIHTGLGKWIYGIMLGLLIVLFRHLSKLEMVSPYAIIIMNAIDHRCDAYGKSLIHLVCSVGICAFRVVCWLGRMCKNGFLWVWNKVFSFLQKYIDDPADKS